MDRRTLASLLLFAAAGACGRSPPPPPPDTHVTNRPDPGAEARDAAERPSTGRLHLPLGTRVVLQGLLILGPSKGFEDGINLRVQRIDGRGTQERIRIKLANENPAGIRWQDLDDRTQYAGQSYEIEGYEDGHFQGLTEEDLRHGVAVQAPMREFTPSFVAVRAKRIEPIVLTPVEFVGRTMLVEGVARTSAGQALLTGEFWVLAQGQMPRWPAEVEGKLVQTNGAVGQTASGHLEVNGSWRLVRLEDQVGRSVELRGVVLSVNDHWWFRYRGTDLYVDGMERLPTWSADLRGTPVEVRGRLEKAMLPRIDQITLKSPPDPAMQFIVRDAALAHTTELLAPEVPATEP